MHAYCQFIRFYSWLHCLAAYICAKACARVCVCAYIDTHILVRNYKKRNADLAVKMSWRFRCAYYTCIALNLDYQSVSNTNIALFRETCMTPAWAQARQEKKRSYVYVRRKSKSSHTHRALTRTDSPVVFVRLLSGALVIGTRKILWQAVAIVRSAMMREWIQWVFWFCGAVTRFPIHHNLDCQDCWVGEWKAGNVF